MRIAVVTTSYPLFAGQAAGHFVAGEVGELCSAGHEVVVFAPGPRRAEEQARPRVVRVRGGSLFGPPGALARLRDKPWRALGAFEFVIGTRRWLARERPFDKIICHWLLPCAWPIASGSGAPLEVVVHGSDLALLGSLPNPLRRRIVASLLRRPLDVRCVSEALRRQLLAMSPAALAPRVRVAPSPLDITAAPRRAPARERLGLEPSERLVLVVARLVSGKRVDVALGALGDLPGVRIVVIGAGPELGRLERMFPAVRFTGELPRPECLTWIAAADALVSASRSEGAPSVIREARALGVPVVACAAGDLESWAARDLGLWLVP